MNIAKPKLGTRGFTLVEIAIVLVIIGLLLGGILKGQELINNAKVRAMADRQNSLKSAWFAFVDRFAGLPGDYNQAQVYITGAISGDGNGKIEITEAPLVFQHLASAGYLRCPHCTETQTNVGPTADNSLVNTYGGIMSIWHDGSYYAVRAFNFNSARRLMIHTGGRIPSNLIAEVDRKIDDGIPNSGDMVFNDYDPNAGGTSRHGWYSATTLEGQCMRIQEDGRGGTSGEGYKSYSKILYWRPANSIPPVWGDCGGAVFI